MEKDMQEAATAEQASPNVNEEAIDEATTALQIADKILHLLSIYPVISPTMLQVGLGPQVKPAIWRPVLEELISIGRVVHEEETLQTPKGRYNTYTKLRLPVASNAA